MRMPSDLPRDVLYSQLAEEATELAHAAQKMARKLRGENPTPVTEQFLDHSITEEFLDVLNIAAILGIRDDRNIRDEKMQRWTERLNDDTDTYTKLFKMIANKNPYYIP